MKIYYLQHVPFEGPGSIETWAKVNGHKIKAVQMFNSEPLPDIDDIDWLVIMGGPMNVYEDNKYPWLLCEKKFLESAIKKGKVVIGICLGAQLIAEVLGSRVYSNGCREIGWYPVNKEAESERSKLAAFMPQELSVFHWHGDTFDIPEEAVHIAGSKTCKNQGFIFDERVAGLQFHLEITPTGAEALIKNCADEIIDTPFIQSSREMLSDNIRFHKTNKVMDRLLNMLSIKDLK